MLTLSNIGMFLLGVLMGQFVVAPVSSAVVALRKKQYQKKINMAIGYILDKQRYCWRVSTLRDYLKAELGIQLSEVEIESLVQNVRQRLRHETREW